VTHIDLALPATTFVQPGRGAVQVQIELARGTSMPPPPEANPLLDILMEGTSTAR